MAAGEKLSLAASNHAGGVDALKSSGCGITFGLFLFDRAQDFPTIKTQIFMAQADAWERALAIKLRGLTSRNAEQVSNTFEIK